MIETKEIAKDEILETFKDEYLSSIHRYERNIKKYAVKMNEDYEHFFRWHGGLMYKAQVNLNALYEMRPMIYWDDLGRIKESLDDTIKNIELTLIQGSQYPTSTSMLHNVAEMLGREAQQELREDLQRLLGVIE